MKKRKLLALSLLAGAFCLTATSCFGATGVTGVNRFEAIDQDTIQFIQLEPCTQGDPTAVIDTTMGVIKIRLFPAQSPKAVENFTTLVKEGYYNGYQVLKITNNRAFIAAEAQGGGKSIYGEPFQNQYSDHLWHFPGTVSSISDKDGYGDSRFYIVGNSSISDDIFKQMKDSNFPANVIEKYKQLGGTPELDRGCNIFGQVYEGLEVVNAINAAPTDEKGIPSTAIIIHQITLGTYGA